MTVDVPPILRPLLGAVAALALGASAVSPAPAAADGDPPSVQTRPATAVTATSATLNGVIGPARAKGFYSFEYGIGDYAQSTPVGTLEKSGAPQAVSVPVTGLVPGAVYHYRLVLDWGGQPRAGADATFTTAPADPAAPAGATAVPALGTSIPVIVGPGAGPVLGASVGVAPVAGVVRVRVPGATGFVALRVGGAVPVGAVVDARAGTVRLTTAVAGGRTQWAEFHGGVFDVRQAGGAGGLTDIRLRGPALVCPRAQARAAAVMRRRPPVRRLWARDRGGRFRTHGRNSVATVRGTSWVTTDTCAGTRTTVTAGAVSVRDLRRHRTVLVRAGHSYLARRR
jgi:hypothetical protein